MDTCNANIVSADQANPRYFNIEGIPPENIEVTINHQRLVRIQGELITELESENGVKKCRKEIVDYKFELPETADEQSIVSEIKKDFIRIKWDDLKNKGVQKKSAPQNGIQKNETLQKESTKNELSKIETPNNEVSKTELLKNSVTTVSEQAAFELSVPDTIACKTAVCETVCQKPTLSRNTSDVSTTY